MPNTNLYQCQHCQAWVDPSYGEVGPAQNLDHAGTPEDPRAPGDHNKCCDDCCFHLELCSQQPTTCKRSSQ